MIETKIQIKHVLYCVRNPIEANHTLRRGTSDGFYKSLIMLGERIGVKVVRAA